MGGVDHPQHTQTALDRAAIGIACKKDHDLTAGTALYLMFLSSLSSHLHSSLEFHFLHFHYRIIIIIIIIIIGKAS